MLTLSTGKGIEDTGQAYAGEKPGVAFHHGCRHKTWLVSGNDDLINVRHASSDSQNDYPEQTAWARRRDSTRLKPVKIEQPGRYWSVAYR